MKNFDDNCMEIVHIIYLKKKKIFFCLLKEAKTLKTKILLITTNTE